MRARRVAAAAILAICIGPMLEAFDQWDHTLQDGNDTEANIVVAALCVGIAVSVAGIVVARIRETSSSRVVARAVAGPSARVVSFSPDSPTPTSSPPTPLRV